MKETKFKQTEVGMIPSDWEVKPFKNVATLINGRAYSQNELLERGKYRVLRVGNFGTNDSWYYSNLELPEKMYCNKGDLLYCWSCTYGAYIWNEEKTIYHYHIWKIADLKAEKGYLQYILNNDVAQQMNSSNGSTMSHITKGFLENRLFAFPPTIEEQQRIATALSDVDSLINNLEKLIAKKKNIKQGAMQQLLTGKKRLKGFESEWKTVSIKNMGTLTGAGVDKKTYHDETPVRLVNYVDVFHKDFIYNNDLNFWTTANQQKLVQCNVEIGDVFFTPSSEMPYDIALSAVAMETMQNVCYSYHIYRLRFNEEIDLKYKTYMFKTQDFYNQANQTCEGSGKRYVISLKKFNELVVRYPKDISEQRAISKILSDMDSEIEALEQKLAKVRNIKQGMMQELLTGKIRLV